MRLARGRRGSGSPIAAPRRGAPRQREPTPEALDIPDLGSGAARPPAAAEAREVFAAIAALPAAFRDVLVAIDVAGLSYSEAGRALHVPEAGSLSQAT
jgi:RNA polymerase sigma-70 factor, ECF subfamily